jgi:hypothetical protein
MYRNSFVNARLFTHYLDPSHMIRKHLLSRIGGTPRTDCRTPALTSIRKLSTMLPPLTSTVSTTSPEFLERATAMDALVHQLETDLATAREGGGPKAQLRMKNKGKLLPRERWVTEKPTSTEAIIIKPFGIPG